MKKELNDTIIAPLTPSVGGSVSLIRISGPNAIARVNKFFPGKDLEKMEGNRFVFGHVVDENGKLIDQVVVLISRGPHSYTGEDVVEISCHANPFVVENMLKLFTSNGCRMADPGEFSKRAFLNEKMDLVQAEAVADLIAAKSRAAVENSLFQLEGKLSQYVREIKTQLVKISGLMELDLDFTEEDLEIIPNEKIISELEKAEKKLTQLLQSYRQGAALKKGIEVLITGKPNVGKSSLMNALLQKNRVIVSDMPGTTRDVVHDEIVVNNVVIRFIDSAGIRFTDQVVEFEGIEKAKEYFTQAQIILLVVDGSEPLNHDDTNLLKSIRATIPSKLIVTVNKLDLGVNPEVESYLKQKNLKHVFVSAKEGTGIEELKKSLVEHIFDQSENIEEEPVLANERQKICIEKAIGHIEKTKQAILAGLGNEFAAVDLREAITELAEITGEITTDDVLNNIFANFCIGK